MTYLLKDEDGDIYAAVSNVGPVDIERAQRAVDKVLSLEDVHGLGNAYFQAAFHLGFPNPLKHTDSKAGLVLTFLVEKCGGTELQFEVWRCGL